MPKQAFMRLIAALLAVATVLGLAPAANACSRVTWLGPDGMVITGRSMDWPYSFHSHLYAVPAGSTQDGAGGVNSLTWPRKYGAIEVAGTTDPKAARKADRDAARQARYEAQQGLRSGDPRKLPARDQGPIKARVRDIVDEATWVLGEVSIGVVEQTDPAQAEQCGGRAQFALADRAQVPVDTMERRRLAVRQAQHAGT